MFDYEWRVATPLYAGRHRKGWLANIADWRRGYRPRVRASRELASPPTAAPDERELQLASDHDGRRAG